MKSEVDTSKVLTWCKHHLLTLGWTTGSAIMSIGVGVLTGSAGGGILSLGICMMVGIGIMAIDNACSNESSGRSRY